MTIPSITTKLQSIPGRTWILIVILALGIFLRTYHFADWLTFNPDQARDAFLIQEMIDGTTWPLLGPQAGNTAFRLGPIFYYFEFGAAKIFGLTPDHLAYPDLLFSILSLPLLYLLSKKYFEEKTALLLSFLYSLSFFSITYSRFAFNPNSIPFFVMLFLLGLSEILSFGRQVRLRFAIAVGIALGIGIQLHTLLLLILPIVIFVVFGYLIATKSVPWRATAIIVGFVLVLNISQIIFETQSGGSNIRAFFRGAASSADSTQQNVVYDFANNLLCHSQGSLYIASSAGSGDKCRWIHVANKLRKQDTSERILTLLPIVGGTLFWCGGVILLFLYLKTEVDPQKKRFLGLLATFIVVSFLIFLPISENASVRYFIISVFFPFFIAGFWIRFYGEHLRNKGAVVGLVLFGGLFVFLNLTSIARSASLYADGKGSTVDIAVYGELQAMAMFIASQSESGSLVFLDGKKAYLQRFWKPLDYVVRPNELHLQKYVSRNPIPNNGRIISLVKRSARSYQIGESIRGRSTQAAQTFGNITLYAVTRP